MALAILGAAACGESVAPAPETASPSVGGVEATGALATALREVDLRPAQEAEAARVLEEAADGVAPGRRLELAVRLRGALDDDQATAVIDRARAALREADHDRRGGRSDRPRESRSDRLRDAARAFRGLDLTEEQRVRLREIGDAHRDELHALRADASGDRAGARERAREILERMREEAAAVLTEAQREELAARREARRDEGSERREAQRERAEAHREEAARVLGLTEDQRERLRAVRELRSGPEGRMDAAADILTPEQRDALALARLLAADHRRR